MLAVLCQEPDVTKVDPTIIDGAKSASLLHKLLAAEILLELFSKINQSDQAALVTFQLMFPDGQHDVKAGSRPSPVGAHVIALPANGHTHASVYQTELFRLFLAGSSMETRKALKLETRVSLPSTCAQHMYFKLFLFFILCLYFISYPLIGVGFSY